MRLRPDRARPTAFTLAVVTLLSACATLESEAPGDGPGDLLAFYRYAATLDPENRTTAYRRFQNWVRDNQCGPDRLRLAMIVMQANSGPAGQADPVTILEPCLADEDEDPGHLRQLALVLDAQIRQKGQISRLKAQQYQLANQRSQLKERLDKVQQDLAQAKRRVRTVEDERDKLRKRVDSLERQLEALKNIERSIRQRN